MRLWFKYFILGGLACWGPEVVLAALGASLHRLWELPNLVLPLTACIAYLLLLRSERRLQSDPSIACSMLAGAWVLAPTLIMLEDTLRGAGFRQGFGKTDLWYLALASFAPPLVIDLTTYDASLGALVFVTVFLAVEHWRHERNHWIIPLLRRRSPVLR
jgi:hypothetical protein